MPISNRVSGILANLDFGLLLRFQFNPLELKFQKMNSYDVQRVTGWSTPRILWTGGEAYTVSFDLFLDGTNGSNDGRTIPRVGTGVMGQISVLKSFQYPKRPVQFSSLSEFAQSAFGSQELFYDPPDAFLVYGPRVFTTKLQDLSFVETAHNENLVPLRATASISLLIIEEGRIYETEEEQRTALALLESGQGALDLSTEVVTNTINQITQLV